MASPIQDSPQELDVIRIRQDFPLLHRGIEGLDGPIVRKRIAG